MAELNLFEDESGQRYAYNGIEYVPVGRDFDPRSSAFVAGLRGAAGSIMSGIEQLRLAIEGDDASLAELAAERAEEAAELSVMRSQSPLSTLAGGIVPYAAGAAVGGGLGGLAGATAVDVGLAAASYGSPGERVANAAIAGAFGGAGAGVARVGQRLRRGSTASERVSAAAEGASGVSGVDALPRGASGSFAQASPAEQDLAGRAWMHMLRMIGEGPDPRWMANKARAVDEARSLGITPTRGQLTGARGALQLEAAFQSNPYTAKYAHAQRSQYLDAIDRTLRDTLLPDEGYQGPLDEAFQARVARRIESDYQRIEDTLPDRVNAEAIDQFASETLEGEHGFENVMGIWPVGSSPWKAYDTAIKAVQEQGEEMTGRQAWELMRSLRREAQRSFDNSRFQEGMARERVAQAIMNQLEETPGSELDRELLQSVNRRWQIYSGLKSRRAFQGVDGVQTGTLNTVLSSRFPTEFAEGVGFDDAALPELEQLFKATRAYRELARPIVGDSGTATRLSLNNLSAEGLGMNFIREMLAGWYYGDPGAFLNAGTRAIPAATLGIGLGMAAG